MTPASEVIPLLKSLEIHEIHHTKVSRRLVSRLVHVWPHAPHPTPWEVQELRSKPLEDHRAAQAAWHKATFAPHICRRCPDQMRLWSCSESIPCKNKNDGGRGSSWWHFKTLSVCSFVRSLLWTLHNIAHPEWCVLDRASEAAKLIGPCHYATVPQQRVPAANLLMLNSFGQDLTLMFSRWLIGTLTALALFQQDRNLRIFTFCISSHLATLV